MLIIGCDFHTRYQQIAMADSPTYDALNRLSSMTGTGGSCLWLSWTYEAWGNRTAQNVTSGTCDTSSLGYNSKNQIVTPSRFQDDSAGNMTNDAQYSYTYDAENEVRSVNGVWYSYDGDGLRVPKNTGVLYWRDPSGQALEETDASGNMQRDYIFFDGRRIAWKDSSGNVYYYFPDVIGSTRIVTDSSGNVCFDADYYPYGQENDYNISCSPTYKFAGMAWLS